MKRVTILGAGVAGVAAAWAARQAGADVTLVDGGPGASSLTSGAVDEVAWEQAKNSALKPLLENVAAFVNTLDLWRIPLGASVTVATSAGALRPARGADAAVLDLSECRGDVIAVARVPRPGWDADQLVASLTTERLARELSLRFVAVDFDVLRYPEERLLPDADLAARHEAPERIEWLADRLAELRHRQGVSSLLFGPWLGAQKPVSLTLYQRSGTRVGEVLSLPGGPAGLRLQHHLQGLLHRLEVPVHQGRATLAHPETSSWRVGFAAPKDMPSFSTDAVVLAVGGLASGGIGFQPSDPSAFGSPPPSFFCPVWSDAVLTCASRSNEHLAILAASCSDGSWTRASESTLERIGVLHRDTHVLGSEHRPMPGLFVAGDTSAGRSRTVLEAVRSGVRAGFLAATSPEP